MYCNTPQVNQLTALLIAHGIHDVVVCPGSRNATIVHDLNEAGKVFSLHPATDERSAAFMALGICLATLQPAAVCVTSGSALLNCIPAVAEAYYRHLPLLVISADRPQSWIGQLDGQTLPQTGALLPYCPTHAVHIPHNEEERWRNNREINAALLDLQEGEGRPAHINVEISEPMFQFTTPELPEERLIRAIRPEAVHPLPQEICRMISEARLPALIIGQYERGDIRQEVEALIANGQMLVLPEVISDVPGNHLLEAFDGWDHTDSPLQPDVVIQVGGNFIHKKFKATLRQSSCKVIRLGEDPELTDTFCHLEAWIKTSPQPALAQLARELPHRHTGVEEATRLLEKRWQSMCRQASETSARPSSAIGFRQAISALHLALESSRETYTLHAANSSTVRAIGRIFASGQQPILCNRGTNGIEGSLSTAVGYALKMWGLNIVVIGDLSFFYDANALWNTRLPDNLRILLLNNNHGSIFDHLPGLSDSPARDEFIAAGHQHFTAQGIAETFHLDYTRTEKAHNLTSILTEWLKPSNKAKLLELQVAGD